MTQTICFVLSDPRLYVSERAYIKTLSQNLITRTTLQAESRRDYAGADPRALAETHHRVDRGDL
jgi:hypothetical protein